MRLDAKFKADTVGLKFHHHEETGTKTATITLRLKIEREKAKGFLGERFDRVAFGAVQIGEQEDGEAYYDFGYESVKPKFVFEQHILKIAGHGSLAVQPVIKEIKPSKDGDAVVHVKLELPILCEKAALAGDLAMSFGEMVDVELSASQGELFGGNGVVHKNTGNWGNPEPVRA